MPDCFDVVATNVTDRLANDLLARWHRATHYHAPLVDALIMRFDRATFLGQFVRASDLDLGDDVTVLRARTNLPRLECQIYVPAYSPINVCRYNEPVEVASNTHWPGTTAYTPPVDPALYVRLTDDVRAVLRVLIFEPAAYREGAR